MWPALEDWWALERSRSLKTPFPTSQEKVLLKPDVLVRLRRGRPKLEPATSGLDRHTECHSDPQPTSECYASGRFTA